MVGKPIASLVGSTRVGFLPRSRGHTLGGGAMSCMSQLRKWYSIALRVSVCGTGLSGSTAVPKPTLGQSETPSGGATLKLPSPPP
jgi:hypothetical protein